MNPSLDRVTIREAGPQDLTDVATMCHQLWPDASVEEHAANIRPLLEGNPPSHLPNVVLVAEEPDQGCIGFLDVGLRSHADGCDPSRPVGYMEGWYIAPAYRRKGVGARLVAAAEDWARLQGCKEIASDTWIDNAPSQGAHEALGFEIVDRCVHYRKDL